MFSMTPKLSNDSSAQCALESFGSFGSGRPGLFSKTQKLPSNSSAKCWDFLSRHCQTIQTHTLPVLELWGKDWQSLPSPPQNFVCSSQAAEIVSSAFLRVLDQLVTIPAVNKWTSIYEALRYVSFACNFHNIIVKAHRRTQGGGENADAGAQGDAEDRNVNFDDDDDDDEDSSKRRRKMLDRASGWFQREHVIGMQLALLLLLRPLMRIHFILFQWGKSGMPQRGKRTEHESHPGLVFDFADLQRSPALRACREMCAFLWPAASGVHNPWFAVNHRLRAEPSQWPDDVWRSLRVALLGALAAMWRRLILLFDSWPFKLACIFDANVSAERKQQRLQEFWDANPCCLDPLVSRRLRSQCRTKADVLDVKTVQFMTQMFNSVTISTSWLETQFAHMKQWLLQANKPLSMSLLSSKYFCHNLQVLHSKDPHGCSQGQPLEKSRPLWVKKPKIVNGENVFIHEHFQGKDPFSRSDLMNLKRQFQELSVEAKRNYSCKAKMQNKQTKAAFEDKLNERLNPSVGVKAGAWGMGDCNYPLALDKLPDQCSGSSLQGHARSWTEAAKRVMAMETPSSDAIPEAKACEAALAPGICQASVSDVELLAVRSFLRRLRIVVRVSAGSSVYNHCLFLLQAGPVAGLIVQCVGFLKKPFSAEFVVYNGICHLWPETLTLQYRDIEGCKAPKFFTETTLAWHCVKLNCTEWDFHVVDWQRPPQAERTMGLEQLHALQSRPFDWQKVEESKANAQALRATKAVVNIAMGRPLQERRGRRRSTTSFHAAAHATALALGEATPASAQVEPPQRRWGAGHVTSPHQTYLPRHKNPFCDPS